MGNYPGSAADPGYWIGALAVVALFFIIAAPVAMVIGIIWAISKTLDFFYPKEKPAVVSEVEVEEAKPEVEAKKFRKHVNVGPAAVDVWFHPETGVAKRIIRIKDKALAAQLGGEKIRLPEVEYLDPGDVEDIVAKTISEVQAKLGSSAKVTIPAKVAQTEKPAKVEKRQTAEAKSSHIGEVLRFGMETRDGRDGKYETFCLQLFDRDVQAPHQLCGVELERAMKEAGVQVGDAVQVENLGRTPVSLPNGKTGHKNLWSVKKVK